MPVDDVDDFVGWFRPDPQAVSGARRFIRRAVTDIDGGPVDGDLGYVLVMAANELATNAVLHARTEFTVRVLIDAHRVRIEVSDGNTRMPQPCLTPAGATSGRGLAIVDGTGLQWGPNGTPGARPSGSRPPRQTLGLKAPSEALNGVWR